MNDRQVTPLLVGLGEVLWDLLPGGRQLGGAPANFAYHAQALGARGVVASAVGDDELGREILARLDALGLDRSAVQVDHRHPTGTVSVQVDADGHPQYVIHEDVAWDFIEATGELTALAGRADAVCFGSLAQRAPASRAAIRRFLKLTPRECLRIFDINLRQSYYDRQVIAESLDVADVLKLNVDELTAITDLFDLPGGEDQAARAMLHRFGLTLVAVTRGSAGSVLITKDQVSSCPPQQVKVADTVGAGDAFTAALALGMLTDRPLDLTHRHAARLAAYVCTQVGATPELPADLAGPGVT